MYEVMPGNLHSRWVRREEHAAVATVMSPRIARVAITPGIYGGTNVVVKRDDACDRQWVVIERVMNGHYQGREA